MSGIKERADRIAGWILRRDGMLKAARLPKVLADMLAEQNAIDIKKACDAYCMESCGHPRTNCDCMSRMNIQKAIEEIILP